VSSAKGTGGGESRLVGSGYFRRCTILEVRGGWGGREGLYFIPSCEEILLWFVLLFVEGAERGGEDGEGKGRSLEEGKVFLCR